MIERIIPQMLSLDNLPKILKAHRSKISLYDPQLRIKTIKQAIDFVNQRGFIFFWLIKDIEFPSLWGAVAGNRPVPSNHDDPGHVTWGWKDSMLGKKVWHYAKVLRNKSTLISLDILPCFYALSKNFGAPDEDYLIQYYDGQLSQTEKVIYELLLTDGPQDTVSMRRKLHLTNKGGKYLFERSLVRLQSDFKIMPVGISHAGGWRYSFIYNLVHKEYPSLIDQSRNITTDEARCRILKQYFINVGGAQISDIKKLFQWNENEIYKSINILLKDQEIIRYEYKNEGTTNWVVLPDLLSNT